MVCAGRVAGVKVHWVCVGGACSWSLQEGQEGGDGMRVGLRARRNFINFTIMSAVFFFFFYLVIR